MFIYQYHSRLYYNYKFSKFIIYNFKLFLTKLLNKILTKKWTKNKSAQGRTSQWTSPYPTLLPRRGALTPDPALPPRLVTDFDISPQGGVHRPRTLVTCHVLRWDQLFSPFPVTCWTRVALTTGSFPLFHFILLLKKIINDKNGYQPLWAEKPKIPSLTMPNDADISPY